MGVSSTPRPGSGVDPDVNSEPDTGPGNGGNRATGFDKILEGLRCARKYDDRVGTANFNAKDPKTWNVYYDKTKDEHNRFIQYKIIKDAVLGNKNAFAKNCTIGTWYYDVETLKPDPASEPAGSKEAEMKMKALKEWENTLKPLLKSEKVGFIDRYENPVVFGTNYVERLQEVKGRLYYCYRTRDVKSTTVPEDVVSYRDFVTYETARNGDNLKACDGLGENPVPAYTANSCQFDRFNALAALDRMLYDADRKRIADIFQEEMERINEEQPPYFHNGPHASITQSPDSARKSWRDRRMTCLITETFSSESEVIFEDFPACQCNDQEKEVFKALGLMEAKFDLEDHKCQVPLDNFLLTKYGRSCLLNDTYWTPLDASVSVGADNFLNIRSTPAS